MKELISYLVLVIFGTVGFVVASAVLIIGVIAGSIWAGVAWALMVEPKQLRQRKKQLNAMIDQATREADQLPGVLFKSFRKRPRLRLVKKSEEK